MDIIVYNDPKNDLYNSFIQPLGTLYFKGDKMIELASEGLDTLEYVPYYYISSQGYSPLDSLSEINNIKRFYPLKEKQRGVKFLLDSVPNYSKKVNLTDTSFDGYHYKRVKISNENIYQVFYIHQTDTILPYSLAWQFDKDYNGILNRIDTYEKDEDRFTTIKLSVSDTIPSNIYQHLNQ